MRICNVIRNGCILIICCKALVVKATTCYWPNGSETQPSRGMQACNSTVNGGDSACCESGDICTNRGFCISVSHGYMYRGACTNKAWSPDVCFPDCVGGAHTDDDFVTLYSCPPNNGTFTNLFCCSEEDNVSCCNNLLDFDTFAHDLTFFPTHSDTTFNTSVSLLSSEANTSPTSSLSHMSRGTITSSSVSPLSSTMTALSVIKSLVLTTSSCRPPPRSNDYVALGAGIGVPLGVLLVLALSFLLLMEHRRRKSTEKALKWIHVRDKSKEKAKTRERRNPRLNNDPTVFELDGRPRNPMELHDGERYETISHPLPPGYYSGVPF